MSVSPTVSKKAPRHYCEVCRENSAAMTDSRPSPLGGVQWRRRYQCLQCERRWTTHEVNVGDGGDLITNGQLSAIRFLRDIERAAREHFGDEAGRFRTGGKR